MTVSRMPPPIDRGWAWVISIGFFLYAFFMVGIAKSYGLILGALIKEFGVSTAYAAVPMTLCLLAYAFASPCTIILGEYFTIQRVVIAGAVIGLVGFALSSLMFSMLYFTLIFGISYGVGNSCFYGNGMILLGKYFRKHRSFANGIALSGASIGQFVLPPVIEYLLENFGLSGAILIIAALYFHGAIGGCLFRPIEQYAPFVEESATAKLNGNGKAESDQTLPIQNGTVKEIPQSQIHDGRKNEFNIIFKEEKNVEECAKTINDDEVDEEGDVNFEQMRLTARVASTGSIVLVDDSSPDLVEDKTELNKSSNSNASSCLQTILRVLDFRVLKNYITIFYTIVSFLCFVGFFNFILFLPGVLKEKGVAGYDKALLISVVGAGDLIARLAIGFIADQNFTARYKLKALACLFCALDILMFLFADSLPWLGVHCFLYGLFGGCYVCLLAVVLVDFVGLASMGKNLAVVLFIQGVGGSSTQPLLGYLKDVTGSFTIVTILCALILALGAILLSFFPLVKKWENQRQKRIAGL